VNRIDGRTITCMPTIAALAMIICSDTEPTKEVSKLSKGDTFAGVGVRSFL
jgi:hypothetical protein